MSNVASAIKTAEAALDKGDYSSCIKIIDSLLVNINAESSVGAQLRLMKMTAYMGMGDEEKAINICQLLIKNKEGSVRQQAKQLLTILDAPSLPRPSNWSVKIPKIVIEESVNSSFGKNRKREKKEIKYPPTGPTKNLGFGFSIFTFLTFLLITLLLSGCTNITTNLSIIDAERLQLSLDIDSNSGKSIPWQMEFAENLDKEHSVLRVKTDGYNQHYEAPPIRFEEVNKLLEQVSSIASKTSGFNINSPEIFSSNRNWFIGTNQNLKIYFDLRHLPNVPGLKINVALDNIGSKINIQTKPLKPFLKKDTTLLPLKTGELNQLEVSFWKWNKVVAGLILAISLTLLSIFLQRFRLKLGFGFPELPP